MTWRVRNARVLQLGVIGLLVTCVAQVAYWVVEEAEHTSHVRDLLVQEYERGVGSAAALLERGVEPHQVEALLPHIQLRAGRPQVIPEHIASLEAERKRRLNRYGWEGSFFFVALLASMGIVAQALRQRAELMRRQENFIAAVSHEFKSPLASLKLSAETLLMREPEPTSTRRIADRMVGDVDRLEAMVSNTLDASRIAEGRLRLEPVKVDLHSEIEAVLRQNACRAHVQGVEVQSLVREPIYALGDPIAIQTVLRNLINNAIKSVTLAGGGRVDVLAQADGRFVRIDVKDDGVGFEKGEASKLFEKFYRPGDELRRKTKGSGLGLYIVKRFIQHSGGRIAAKSAGHDQGATFSVWLPRAKEQRA